MNSRAIKGLTKSLSKTSKKWTQASEMWELLPKGQAGILVIFLALTGTWIIMHQRSSMYVVSSKFMLWFDFILAKKGEHSFFVDVKNNYKKGIVSVFCGYYLLQYYYFIWDIHLHTGIQVRMPLPFVCIKFVYDSNY